ncbi:MAG: thioredoxin [Bacteroidia bacterium]|nr:thioredoxin [Bacteroidia bacterium]
MNKLITLLLLVIACLSCESNTAQEKGGNLDAAEFKKQIENSNDIQLVDVRTTQEFNDGHLKNAVLMNYNSPEFKSAIEALDKNKPTYVYCLSGGRSSGAVSIMKEKGFKEVYNLNGGILSWKKNNYPISGANEDSGISGMTRAQFDSMCNSNKPILFDFMAKWCGPCKALKPILDEIEKEYPEKVQVVSIDIDVHKTLAKELKIYNIPFMMFYKDGKHQTNIEGLTNKETLIETLGLNK